MKVVEIVNKQSLIRIAIPDGPDHIGNIISSTGSFYEIELLNRLRSHLNPGDTVIDVGSNIGNHTIFFSALCGCRVVSYEPSAVALKLLRENVRLNQVESLVDVRPMAVGDKVGLVEIAYEDLGNLGATQFCEQEFGSIPMVALDGDGISAKVRLMKIDAEGMEADVLEGAQELIDRDRPIIVCEAATPDDLEKVNCILERNGYKPFGVYCATPTYIFWPFRTDAEKSEAIKSNQAEILRAQKAAREASIASTEIRRTLIAAKEVSNAAVERQTGMITEIREQIEGVTQDQDQLATEMGQHSQTLIAFQLQIENSVRHQDQMATAGAQHTQALAELRHQIDGVALHQDKLATEMGQHSQTLIAFQLQIENSVRHQDQMATAGAQHTQALAELRHQSDLIAKRLSELAVVEEQRSEVMNGLIFRSLHRLQNRIKKLMPKSTLTQSTSGSAVTPQASTGPALANPIIPQTETDIPWPQEVSRKLRMERPKSTQARDAVISRSPLVSVVMTTFNSAQYVERAVLSILDQTYKKIELIVVDDASRDNTIEIVRNISHKYKLIKIIELPRNRGTYWAKNVGLQEAAGEVITFMDSDDWSSPDRITKQLAALRADGAVASTCHYVRRTEVGELVLNRGLHERIGLISLMLKRQVLDEIGLFDTVRTSADAEMYDRIRAIYGRKAISNVPEALYTAYLWQGSLTNGNENANNLNARKPEQFLSTTRLHYTRCYQKWHAEVRAAGKNCFMPFPVTNRPFAVHGALQVSDNRYSNQPIVAFMATFPARRKSLQASVASLLPQVDRIYIYMNGYQEVPEFLSDERIVALPAAKLDDLRDNGKFYHMETAQEGYFFTVDDDIIYPVDYCDKLVQKIEQYDRRSAVGVHGVIVEQPFVRYFSRRREVFSFKRALDEDKQVNFLGTGTLAFHSSTLRPTLRDFPSTGMADVWFGILAKKQSVPLISVTRKKGWLDPISTSDTATTLYDEFHENDSEHNTAIATQGDWNLPKAGLR